MNPATRSFTQQQSRTALVVGHPGHELVVHGWLEKTKPLVCVITDGSGRSKQSRLASTTRILNEAGAASGTIYGRLTDAQAYAALLNHDFALFVDLARELSEVLISTPIDCVAGDAGEGYNPVHDVCRLLTNAAVTVAQRVTGHHIETLQFSLIGQDNGCRDSPHHDGSCRMLDDSAFSRKLAAAKAYVELDGEVQAALGRTSIEAHRLECLRPVDLAAEYCFDQPPFYESYGEKQAAAGHYERVLRYHEHMVPLAGALRLYATDAAQQ